MTKFNLIAFVFLFQSISVFAQDMEARTLNIAGKSHLSVDPDEVVVQMNVQATESQFNDAIKELNKKTDKLIKTLDKSGFDKNDLKTSDFSVRKNITYDQGKSIDHGFIATQAVVLKFEYNKDKLGDLMEAYSKSPVDVNLNFNFQLSEKARKTNTDQLIRMAVQDAKEKAQYMAGVAGIKLGKIKTINYGNSQNIPRPLSYSRMKVASADQTGAADLSPQNIDLYDEVGITWEIE